jgi:hypothetical protein
MKGRKAGDFYGDGSCVDLYGCLRVRMEDLEDEREDVEGVEAGEVCRKCWVDPGSWWIWRAD